MSFIETDDAMSGKTMSGKTMSGKFLKLNSAFDSNLSDNEVFAIRT